MSAPGVVSKLRKVAKILWKYGWVLITGYEIKEAITAATNEDNKFEKKIEAIEKTVVTLQKILNKEKIEKSDFAIYTVLYFILFLIVAMIVVKLCVTIGRFSLNAFKRFIQQ